MRKSGFVVFFFVLLFFDCVAAKAQNDVISDTMNRVYRKCSEIIDMKCTFVKDVTKEGKKYPRTSMSLKYKKEPESIYLEFLDNYKGQKCLYVRGQNDDKIIVRPAGIMNFMELKVDPLGSFAMAEDIDAMTNMGLETVIKMIDRWYEQSVTDEDLSADFKDDVVENGSYFYKISIYSEKDPNQFVNLLIDQESMLPYKIDYRTDNNSATYVYEGVTTNCNLSPEDFQM